MTKSLSLYLNFLRVVAAALVFLTHLLAYFLSSSRTWAAFEFLILGHDAVIVFFVLSGYVISYAGTEREKSGKSYVLARVTRISSVLIPALLLSFLVNYMLCSIFPQSGLFPWKPWDPLLALTLLTQSVPTPYNLYYDGPFWSLNYEIWYYVGFGIALFAPTRALKVGGTIVAMLIAGPKIVTLAPIWLFGVAAYHVQRRFVLPSRGAVALFAATIATYVLVKPFDPYYLATTYLTFPIERATGFLFYSSNGFGWDWFLGLLTALNIFAFRSFVLSERFLSGRTAKLVTAASGVTFSVYLYHEPLLLLIANLLKPDIGPHWTTAVAGVVGLTFSVLLAAVTEQKRGSVLQAFRWVASTARSVGTRGIKRRPVEEIKA